MKILLVYNQYQEPGGEEVVVAKERDLLAKHGHDVSEYRRDNDEIKQYSALQRIGLVYRTVWASDSYQQFDSLLRKIEPDVVHVHNTFPLISPSIFWACKKQQVPVVHTLHNYRLLCPQANFYRAGKTCEDCMGGSFWKGAVHGCYRDSRLQTVPVSLMLSVHHSRKTWTSMVDRYITPTEFAKSRFVNAGFPDELVSVKPNFVDPDPGQRAWAGSYALFIGRISKEKGAHTLVEAWRRLPADSELQIVGDGPTRAQLESESAKLPNVKFMGRLPHADAVRAVKGSKMVIFPSELYETFGLGIVEANACGVPVLASRLGAMQEVVREGRTGMLFVPGDPDDLARKVAEVWDNPDYLNKLGQQGRKEYEARYTAEANYQRLMGIYEEVTSRPSDATIPVEIEA